MSQTATPSKILFLTSELPYPAYGGGKIRDQQLIKLLREKLEVELLCFGSGEILEDPTRGIPENMRVAVVDRRKAAIWRRALYPFRPYVVNGYSLAMEKALRARAEPGKLLWVSRLAMAQYIPLARELGYRVILDEHNVETNILRGDNPTHRPTLKNLSGILLSAQCNYYETRFCEIAHVVVATSDIDASRLSKMAPDASVHVIPNAVDCEDFTSARSAPGSTLFFSGTLSYDPNIDGLNWFMAEVLPRLKGHFGKNLPRIVVAGADPSPILEKALGAAGIELYANPPSMLPFIAEAAVVFVPIRKGSGTRLKILESMAAGRAVVSTGKGAEGLTLSPGFDILIADDPDRFTSAIVRLFENTPLRNEMGGRASVTIENRYDWRKGRPMLDRLLSHLSGEAAPSWQRSSR